MWMTSGNITKKVNCNKIYGKKFHYRDKEIKNSNMKYDVDKNEQRAKEVYQTGLPVQSQTGSWTCQTRRWSC